MDPCFHESLIIKVWNWWQCLINNQDWLLCENEMDIEYQEANLWLLLVVWEWGYFILEDIYGLDWWRENGFPLFLHNIFLKMVQMDFFSPSQHISYFTSLPWCDSTYFSRWPSILLGQLETMQYICSASMLLKW